MKLIYTLIVFLLFIVKISLSQTTEGKEFWVGFMENHQDSIEIETIIYISSAYFTKGKLEIPNTDFKIQFEVNKDSSIKIKLPTELVMAVGSGIIEKKGIHITSEKAINVFALNYKKHTADAALIYPVDALGQSYVCVGYDGTSANELLIVSIEDNSQIEINPKTSTLNGHIFKFTITLNRGETYQLKFNEDLTGTTLISKNNTFAVFSGAQCTYVPKDIPACDHLYEQVPPLTSWGKKYGVIPLKTRAGDTYRIISNFDNTKIYFNGEHEVNLNSYQNYEVLLSEPTIIQSNEPILVAQYSRGQNYDSTSSDPFMIFLSPVEQTRNEVTFNAFSSQIIETYYLNLFMRTKDISTLKIDGKDNYADKFKVFSSDSKYSFAQLTITQGNHHIESGGRGFTGYVYGYGNYESYGYHSGARVENINEFKFRIGLFGGYSYYMQEKTKFLNFKEIPTCYRNYFELCDEKYFVENKTNGFNLGILTEIPSLLTTPFGIGGRLSINYSIIDFQKNEFAFENTELERKLKNNARIQLYSINTYPYLIFTLFENFNLYTGVNWTFNLYATSKYKETIDNSRIVHELNNKIYENQDDFYIYYYQVIGGVTGIGYEFILNENRSLRLSPELFYFHNLTNTSKEFNQKLNHIQIGISFKWGY